MSIGTLSTKENGSAGGIVGKLDKNGSIQIAYSAQTAIEGGTTGAVFGAKEETAGAVNNTYYQDTLSGNEEQGTAKTAAEMKSNAFKEELNTLVAGNEELCSWTWNSTKNQGYPRILSSLITEVELVNVSRGLTVKGMMHKDTKLQLNELDKKNDIYQAFKKYAQKTDKQVLYSAEPTLVYEDGQPSAYEGNLNVKLDLSKYRGKGYKVLVYRNNQIEELEIDKQMIASKDVEEMVPFAVLAEKSELSKAVDHIKDTIKTGDNSKTKIIIGILIAAVIAAAGITWYVMNQKNQKTGNSSAEVVAWDVDIEEEEPSEEKGILIPGYTSMVMKANTKEQTVSIGNPADNDCIFVIVLKLEDGTKLFESQELKPGEGLENITLDQELEAGEYQAVIEYKCYSLEDKSPLNGGSAEFKLYVKE